MGDERFIQGVLSEQMMQLADQVGVPTQLQFAPNSLQGGRSALLFQAMPYASDPITMDPGQCLTAPKPICGAEQRRGVIVVAARGDGDRFTAQPTELVKIDILCIDLKYVTVRPSHQPHAVTHGVPERRPQPSDVHV
jgi:hypothetical protein